MLHFQQVRRTWLLGVGPFAAGVTDAVRDDVRNRAGAQLGNFEGGGRRLFIIG